MGFLDQVLKTAGKAKNVLESLDDIATSAASTNHSTTQQHNTANQNGTVTFSPNTITIVPPANANTREVSNVIYDTDANGTDYEITQYFQMVSSFHVFNAGAAEIDTAYAYTPDISDIDAYCEWEPNTPAVSICFDERAYKIVEQYEKNGTIPPECTLSKVNHQSISYKTTYKLQNCIYICYHFRRGFDTNLYYQFEGFFPESDKGTNIELQVLTALNEMACTYREEQKPER